MKKLTVLIFLLLSMIILCPTIFASEADYTWVDNGDGTATITGYTGTDNDLVIPNKLNGLTVTTIGEYAFDHQTKGVQLTSVVIPDSVTTIGKYAFYYNSLTKLIIPDSVTSIGEAAFYQNSLVEVTLSENITALGEYAFGYNYLTEVTIPDKLTHISKGLFFVNDFVEFTFPENITTIENSAFSDNRSLKGITVLNKNASIGETAFGSYITLTIYGYDPSSAKDYALDNGHNFVPLQAKNPSTENTVTANVLSGGLSLLAPPIQTFGQVTLQDSAQVYHTSFDQAFQIKDLRGSQEGWRLDVSASPFSNGDHDLPSGSLRLVPLDSIVRVGVGSGGLPSNSMTSEMIIDAGTIEVAKAVAGSGMGVFDFTFPNNALSVTVDPTTAKVGTYESTLTWNLVTGP